MDGYCSTSCLDSHGGVNRESGRLGPPSRCWRDVGYLPSFLAYLLHRHGHGHMNASDGGAEAKRILLLLLLVILVIIVVGGGGIRVKG